MHVMPIEHIDDWEQRLARQDAFWNGAIIDRPVVSCGAGQPNPDFPPPPQKEWATHRDRWMDIEHIAQSAVHNIMNCEYFGDGLPGFSPNLGPEVFSAMFGAEMEYGESTSWSIPNLKDWADTDKLRFSKDNFYFKKLDELTDALLDAGRGKFYVGTTDWHPGGDCVAAFRDPLNLNIDMIEHVDEVKAMIRRVTDAYFEAFDHFHNKLTAAGQAGTNWSGIVSSKKWYVPSNDFSCMVSKEMFDDVFLPGIAEECRFFEATIYHLDGPGALRHLDSLLDIPELNAIQWVAGAGNGSTADWIDVYKRCQAAGKGIQVYSEPDELLDYIMENLRPEGVWLGLGGIGSREQFDDALKRIEKWT